MVIKLSRLQEKKWGERMTETPKDEAFKQWKEDWKKLNIELLPTTKQKEFFDISIGKYIDVALQEQRRQTEQIWTWLEHHQDEAERDFDELRRLYKQRWVKE